MIDANQNFQSELAGSQKRPLYALEIPAFGIIITSFTSDQNLLATGAGTSSTNAVGWGVGLLWGVSPWGS